MKYDVLKRLKHGIRSSEKIFKSEQQFRGKEVKHVHDTNTH